MKTPPDFALWFQILATLVILAGFFLIHTLPAGAAASVFLWLFLVVAIILVLKHPVLLLLALFIGTDGSQ